MRDVARRLGVRNGTVLEVVAAGLLPQPDRRWAYVFDLQAVEAFQEEYVLDVQLVTGNAGTPEEVREALELIGVFPVLEVGLRGKGRKAGVFRRADVPSAGWHRKECRSMRWQRALQFLRTEHGPRLE